MSLTHNNEPMNNHNDNTAAVGGAATAAAAGAVVQHHSNHPNHHSVRHAHAPVITEAQLRWAQFHHKRAALDVRTQVQQFWLTPASPSQVPGALSDDGNSSSDDCSSGAAPVEEEHNSTATTTTTKLHQRPRPVISRGRRALLRVSQRALVARQEAIRRAGGYPCRGEPNVHTTTSSTGPDDDDNPEEDEPDALRSIFAEETFWQKKQRQRRWKQQQRRRRHFLYHRHNNSSRLVKTTTSTSTSISTTKEDDERIHRFESAFLSMMETLAAQQQPHELPSATKRWTRPVTAAHGMMEYTDYLKWGGTNVHPSRRSSQQQQQSRQRLTPLDRSASWLMHSSAVAAWRNQKNRPRPEAYPAADAAAMMMEEEYHDTKDDDATTTGRMMSTDFTKRRWQLEQFAQRRRLPDEQRVDRNEYKKEANGYTDMPIPHDAVVGFVKQLVAQIEQAAEPGLIAPNGTLHKPTFLRLVQRYLLGAQQQQQPSSSSTTTTTTPMVLAHARQSAGSMAARPRQSSSLPAMMDRNNNNNDHNNNTTAATGVATSGGDGVSLPASFVGNFMAQMETDDNIDDSNLFITTTEGKLDTAVLEQLVTRYLARAADQCLVDAQQQHEQEGMVTPRRAAATTVAGSHDRSKADFETSPPSPFDEMRRFNATATRDDPEDDDDDTDVHRYAFSSAISTNAETPRRTTASSSSSFKVTTVYRLADSVTNKVGGFMKLFHKNNNNDTADTTAELQAVADFRKSRAALNDDTSSASSYRVLPDGIKNVVKNFRGLQSFQQRRTTVAEDDSRSYLQRSESYATTTTSYQMHTAASFETMSSYQTTSTAAASAAITLSPERLREFHKKMLEKSALLNGAADHSVIDTDGNISDTSGSMLLNNSNNNNMVANLLLSPTLLTKRLHQAIRAIENRNWEQISYLMSANPWLAEMPDIKSNQYLLHKLAYYGSGDVNVDPETGAVVSLLFAPAPTQINTDLIRMFASAVHKFDQDGNLPLHMACASGNLPMVQLLGDRFPSGASVRNEDGMLPLHLAILSCAAPISALSYNPEHAFEMVKSVLSYFPAALGVKDNEGNLPIHTAASVLVGDSGADVIFLLLDEAERQTKGPAELRFRNKTNLAEDLERNLSMDTESTAAATDASQFDGMDDEGLHCNMVRNDRGETPLITAIHARAGWEVIEAIACGPGGVKAAIAGDADEETALHLLASSRCMDPDAFYSILNVAPAAASVPNADGMLPIEVACMQMLPRDVIVAIVLADLPIDLERRHDLSLFEGRGSSWWFLTCESDDFHVDIVEEILSFFTHAQAQTMCLLKSPSGDALLDRATPACRSVLQAALRLAGRFEFTDKEPVFVNSVRGLKVFHALDFGDVNDSDLEARKVLLHNFATPKAFEEETSLLGYSLDFTHVEEIVCFTIDNDDWNTSTKMELGQYFLSIEQPNLTLGGVMKGMLKSEECRLDSAVRQRYASKVFSVLRLIAKALRHLHSLGIVHGNVNLENCCKFDDKWKLADVLRSQQIGASMRISRLSSSSPPESLETLSTAEKGHQVTFKSDYVCSPSMDCWALGKMAYEVLVGSDLFKLDKKKRFEDDHRAMTDLLHWSSFNCEEVRQDLSRVGVSDDGASLVAMCLSPDPGDRPSMEEVLRHSVWNDLREQRSGVC